MKSDSNLELLDLSKEHLEMVETLNLISLPIYYQKKFYEEMLEENHFSKVGKKKKKKLKKKKKIFFQSIL